MKDAIVLRKEDAAPSVKSTILRSFIGLALAFGITIAAIAAFAAVLYFGSVSEKWISPVATVSALLSLFLGAGFAAKHAKVNGFFLGGIIGISYYILLYACALTMYADFNFSLRTAVFMLIGALVGGVGGLSGQSAKEKNRKRRKKKN